MWFRASDKELKELLEGFARVIAQFSKESRSEGEYPDMRTEIRQLVKESVAEQLASWNGGTSLAVEEHLARYPGRDIELMTPAGSVRGILVDASKGVAEIREPEGGTVLVFMERLIGFEWQ